MEKVNVTCPCCGAKTDMKFETMILAQDKKTVKKLLDRSLFSHKCSSCKQNFEYYNTFWFKDSDKSFKIACVEDSWMVAEFENRLLMAGPQSDEDSYQTIRVVDSYKTFKEKYLILNSGFDDRVIELIKLRIRKNDCAECGEIERIFFFGSNDKSVFIKVRGLTRSKVFYVPLSEYEDVKKRYKDTLDKDNNVVIDAAWAVEHEI